MQNKYIYLLGKFWDFSEDKQLGSSAILIYLYLLKEAFNRNNARFSISDVQISKNLYLTRKTVKENKNILLKNGLIDFKTKNGVPCNYQIITDYPLETDDSNQKIEKKIATKQDVKKQDIVKKQSNNIEQNLKQNSGQLSKDLPQNIPQKALNKDIPTLEEFLLFAKTLNSYDDSLDENLKSKYEEWTVKGWKNNFNRPITDWKSTIKNTMPYLKNRSSKNIDSIQSIPNIRRSGIDKV
jgi:hypothetical protein